MGQWKKGDANTTLRKERFNLSDDVHINVRELTATEFNHFLANKPDKEIKNIDFMCDVLSRCVIDDDGKPVFDSPDDLKSNFNVGVSKLMDIQEKIFELSEIKKQDSPKN